MYKKKPTIPSIIDGQLHLSTILNILHNTTKSFDGTVHQNAITEIFLHNMKYPNSTTIGILIGRSVHGKVEIAEAIPVSHTATLSQMLLESALEIVNLRLTRQSPSDSQGNDSSDGVDSTSEKLFIIGLYVSPSPIPKISEDSYAALIAYDATQRDRLRTTGNATTAHNDSSKQAGHPHDSSVAPPVTDVNPHETSSYASSSSSSVTSSRLPSISEDETLEMSHPSIIFSEDDSDDGEKLTIRDQLLHSSLKIVPHLVFQTLMDISHYYSNPVLAILCPFGLTANMASDKPQHPSLLFYTYDVDPNSAARLEIQPESKPINNLNLSDAYIQLINGEQVDRRIVHQLFLPPQSLTVSNELWDHIVTKIEDKQYIGLVDWQETISSE